MKRAFEFDVLSPGDGDWEKWYELSNNDDISSLNESFFAFSAGHSAWGNILEIFRNEIFPNSDIYRFELYGPAINVNHPSWPKDIDHNGEYGEKGASLYPNNIFDILPENRNEQLYYIYQSFEKDFLLADGVFQSKHYLYDFDDDRKNVPFEELDYSPFYANVSEWTDMALKGENSTKSDMLTNWISPDCFYSAFYGMVEFGKNSELSNDENPFPFILRIEKYDEDGDKLISLDEIQKRILQLRISSGIEIYGIFYCDDDVTESKNDEELQNRNYKNIKDTEEPQKENLSLIEDKTHRIAVEDLNKVVLNMVYTEIGESNCEVFGVYSGMLSSGPHICYFHQDQEGEFLVSDDYFEFETNQELSEIFRELDDLRNEFEIWDDEQDSFNFSEAGKEFLKANLSIDDDGWIEAYSPKASEDFIYDLQDEWQLSLYKD